MSNDQLVPDRTTALEPFMHRARTGQGVSPTDAVQAAVSALLLPEILNHAVQFRGRRRVPRIFKDIEQDLYNTLLASTSNDRLRGFLTDVIKKVRAEAARYDARLAKATGEAPDDSQEQNG